MKKPISEICFVYNRGVVLRGPEGVPTHCSLFARVPGDWKYDWPEFRAACRKSGMRTLREAGLKSIHEGLTTIEEVIRETILDDT